MGRFWNRELTRVGKSWIRGSEVKQNLSFLRDKPGEVFLDKKRG